MARYHRVVPYLADGRKRWVHVYTFERASLISQHWNAIQRFLNDGDVGHLEPFDGIEVAGRQLELDPDLIEYLAMQGELELDEFYREHG